MTKYKAQAAAQDDQDAQIAFLCNTFGDNCDLGNVGENIEEDVDDDVLYTHDSMATTTGPQSQLKFKHTLNTYVHGMEIYNNNKCMQYWIGVMMQQLWEVQPRFWLIQAQSYHNWVWSLEYKVWTSPYYDSST